MRDIWRAFLAVFSRELAINIAQQGQWAMVLMFYVIVVSLFPIAHIIIAPSIGITIIWVAVLLTAFIAQESILRLDYQIGIFDQMLLSHGPFSLLLLAKICAHWLTYAMPMILLTPIIGVSLSLSGFSIAMLCLSLFLGTLILFLVGAIGSALTVSLARGGVLLAVLILPLYVPVLVLGNSIGILSTEGIIAGGQIALLAALAIGALLTAPLAVAYAIKINLN